MLFSFFYIIFFFSATLSTNFTINFSFSFQYKLICQLIVINENNMAVQQKQMIDTELLWCIYLAKNLSNKQEKDNKMPSQC